MNQATRQKILGTGEKVGHRLLEYVLTVRERRKVMELDKELAEAKANAEERTQSAPTPTPTETEPASTPEPQTGVVGQGTDMTAVVKDLMEDETCGVCQQMLGAIEACDDPQRQARALVEYGRLRQGVADDIPDDEWRALLESSAVLTSLMEQHSS